MKKPVECLRCHVQMEFGFVLDGGGGVRNEQKPSTLGAQKIALSMAVNARRQDPPQQEQAR